MTPERRKDGTSLTNLRGLRDRMPRWVLVLLAFGIAAVIASRISHLLITLIVAAVIAFIFSSVISAFEGLGIRRSAAVMLLFVLAAALLFAAYLVFFPGLQQEIMNAYAKCPDISRQMQDVILPAAHDNARNYPFIESSIKDLLNNVFGAGGFLEQTFDASKFLKRATPFIMAPILVPFFVFFLLKDWPSVMKRAMASVPPSYVETTISVIEEINILVGKYFRGLAADCLIIGALASAGLWLLGINYPITLGILTGVVNIIPYFGPIVGGTASAVIALMQYGSFDPLLHVIVLYLVIKLADDLIIQPVLIGKGVRLHPMLLVITLIVGEKLFGIIGMIVGVPVVTAGHKAAGILWEHHLETRRMRSRENLINLRENTFPVRPL
jgi:predicted PurR-regulated permease PerM